jgi:hypothetical protein|tara:strand:- start:229 stop:429 length:201 start_codon:yes stop_codon:yes gene_type:complete
MATELKPGDIPTSDIESNSKSIENLSATPEANDLDEFFDDSKHLDPAGNVVDESAIWVYFGVGGPA